MNRKELDRFRALLVEKREELVADVEEVRSRSAQDSEEEDKDYIDYAVSSYTKEFLYSLSDLERKQLILVDKALRTIDEGTYGTCEECGEEIDDRRLNAVPWATHCLPCQELADRGLLRARADSEDE